jgi:hypothetical protein
VKTLSGADAAAASALPLGDRDVRDGAGGRLCGVRVVALGGGTGLPVLLRGIETVLFPSPRSGGRAREHDCLHIHHDASKFAVEGLALEAVR